MQIQSYSPLNGKKLNSFAVADDREIKRTIANAVRTKLELQATSIDRRVRALGTLKNLLTTRIDAISRAIHEQVGKPLPDAMYEVQDTIDGIAVYIRRASEVATLSQTVYQEGVVPDARFAQVQKIVGPIGAIMPWNFPFWMPMSIIVPAILAGNPVILKPSEYAPGVGKLIEDVCKELDLPSHAVQTVIGGPWVGSKLVQSEEVGRIFFVGSTNVGRNIARERIKNKNNHLTLEMGGNSPVIITENADLDLALPAAFWQSTYYAGQVCSGAKRLLVQDSIVDVVQKRLVAMAGKCNQPDFLSNSIGAIISRTAMATFEYRVDQAVRAGNELLTGGRRLSVGALPEPYKDGSFFPVTVLGINNREVDLIQKETFGPFIPIIPFKTLEEARAIADETVFGLSMNIFTDDLKEQEFFLQNVTAGMVFINDSELAYPGGNFWKGAGGSYFSTGSDDRLYLMFESQLLWDKVTRAKRDYWFKV